MPKNTQKNNFTQIWTKKVAEKKAVATMYQHNKTKTEVLFFNDGREDKMFSIFFNTPAQNDKGTTHILEHMVFGGSKKYPVRDLLLEIDKKSLNTFINANIGNNRTAYFIASQNAIDFQNITDIYLDMVLNPLLEENNFKTEGWRYFIKNEKSKKDNLTYQGTVYNEMKGMLSSLDTVIFNTISKALMPDTIYAFEAGGDPQSIPNLSHKELLKYHTKHYHPSNAKVVFLGNVDQKLALQQLDHHFEKLDYKKPIKAFTPQKRFTKPVRSKAFFATDSDATKGALVYGLLLKSFKDTKEFLGFLILNHYLIESDVSPVKKALLDNNLGEEFLGWGLFENVFQNTFVTGLKGVEPKNFTKVEKTIETIFAQEYKNLNKDALASSLNFLELYLKEEQRSFDEMRKLINGWIYNNDPLIYQETAVIFKQLRQELQDNSNYFEKLIQKHLLKNMHKAIAEIYPDKSLAAKLQKEEEKRLAQIKAKANVKQLSQETAELEKWQNEEDTPEALQTIPDLKIGDIERDIQKIPHIITKINSVPVLANALDTNGIVYLDIAFDLTQIPQELVPYIGLWSDIFTRLDTNKYTHAQVVSELNKYTTGLDVHVEAELDTKENLQAQLVFSTGFLEKNWASALNIITEIILNTDLTKTQSKIKLPKIIAETISNQKVKIIELGHRYTAMRSGAKLSISENILDLTSGLAYHDFLKKLEKKKALDKDIVLLKEVLALLAQNNEYLINLTSKNTKVTNTICETLTGVFMYKKTQRKSTYSKNTKVKEVYKIDAAVNYNSLALDIDTKSFTNSGSNIVAQLYLNNKYLWQKVRTEGGAYGAYSSYNPNNKIFVMYSYRDPNTTKTLDIFKESGNFLANTKLTKKDVTNLIIGTIGKLEDYKTPKQKHKLSRRYHMLGYTDKHRQKIKNEILTTTNADIVNFGKVLQNSKRQASTILGSN